MYAYCLNNPVNNMDPSGKAPQPFWSEEIYNEMELRFGKEAAERYKDDANNYWDREMQKMKDYSARKSNEFEAIRFISGDNSFSVIFDISFVETALLTAARLGPIALLGAINAIAYLFTGPFGGIITVLSLIGLPDIAELCLVIINGVAEKKKFT